MTGRPTRVLLLVLTLSVAATACRDNAPTAQSSPSSAPPVDEASTPSPLAASVDSQVWLTRAPDAWPERVDAIVVGGGAVPEANQVQMEQDAMLAVETLGEHVAVLFGSGPGGAAVQVLDDAPRGDDLRQRLGRLLAPRGGRDARYRRTQAAPLAAATRDNVLALLQSARSSARPEPLTVFVATHGLPGATPAESAIELWGGGLVTAVELAEVLDAPGRPTRLVMTSCFGGGFAETVFVGAVPARGVAADRCGLFATTWDLEASGCDANPERAEQEGYGLHVLQALQGRDRDGAPVALASLDLDGDGVIGLLDAHTRARIVSRGIDVPTTTSERWLREVAPWSGPDVEVELPEERAVITALSADTGLTTAAEAQARLAALQGRVDAGLVDEESLLVEEDAAWREVAAELLARWPVLDDPWHPDFEATMTGEREAIETFLERHPAMAAWRSASSALDRAVDARAALQVERARVERLVRAWETVELARRLAAVGGDGWATWASLRACERMAP